jgi:glycosyltransferase involved in cell wall biosynthesis
MQVTTVIPTYNRAHDVVIAVDSALAQHYPRDRHEIIVVDDGSNDDTAAVLEARFGDRIRVLRKVNGGVSAARNHGVAHARGDAIAFLDSDDSWAPDKLSAQVDVLNRRPEIAMVLTSLIEIDSQRRPLGPVSRRSTVPVDGFVLPYVLRNPVMGPSTAMVRTAVVREIGGFDPALRTAEDLDFHLKVALHHQIAVLDQPLVFYMRDNDHGLSTEARSYSDQVAVIERFVASHAGELAGSERSAALFRAYLRNAFGFTYRGELASALRYATRSLRHARRPTDAWQLGWCAMRMMLAIAASRGIKPGKLLRRSRSRVLVGTHARVPGAAASPAQVQACGLRNM